MRKPYSDDAVIEGLLLGAASIVPAPDREAWDYGWAYEDYRHSPGAALTGVSGTVTIERAAIAPWEAAVLRLLRDPKIRTRWEADEFWSIMTSLTVDLASRDIDTRAEIVQDRLQKLREAGPAFTVQLLANVTWEVKEPLALGDVIVGAADAQLFDTARTLARGRATLTEDQAGKWISDRVTPRRGEEMTPVAVACWTPGQHDKSIAQCDRVVRDIVDLPLLLERDLKSHGIYRRGDVNRPGQRGLVLDRGAIELAMKGSSASLGLASFPITATDTFPPFQPVHWYSAEPLPLGELLAQESLRDAVSKCMNDDDPIARRIRVAARWHSEAHYTNARDDATLALGVSLDALLTGTQALPGAAMADRFALLGEVPAERRARRRQYLDCYRVRSSIAHGGASKELERPDFLSSFFSMVRDTAWRLVRFKEQFRPTSESSVDETFDDLRMGATSWK